MGVTGFVAARPWLWDNLSVELWLAEHSFKQFEPHLKTFLIDWERGTLRLFSFNRADHQCTYCLLMDRQIAFGN